MLKFLWLAPLASLAACATTMAPGATNVTLTHDAATVTHCKSVGSVKSSYPIVWPGDDLKQIKNQSIGMGADTVLITGPQIMTTSGVAYRCKT